MVVALTSLLHPSNRKRILVVQYKSFFSTFFRSIQTSLVILAIDLSNVYFSLYSAYLVLAMGNSLLIGNTFVSIAMSVTLVEVLIKSKVQKISSFLVKK